MKPIGQVIALRVEGVTLVADLDCDIPGLAGSHVDAAGMELFEVWPREA